ncbi:hypothetical protein [Nocardia brasiliensis]|uniref:hypothetical protein n=1 Tax=Nocardia brasiliensis TaxID=37326 RepID=UPI00245856A3|nr:hypothetical protein [Nocardia brasiliensis]
MTTTQQVTIRSLVIQVLEETGLSDPREIAEKVASMIPAEQQRRMLVDALVGQVRLEMGQQRNNALTNVFTPAATPRPAPAIGGSIQTAPKYPPVNRSAKVAGIRDWWADMLTSRIHVGDSRWMQLGQCGMRELEFAEHERRDQAAKEINRAKQFMRLRELLEKYDVKTVAELPENAARAAVS